MIRNNGSPIQSILGSGKQNAACPGRKSIRLIGNSIADDRLLLGGNRNTQICRHPQSRFFRWSSHAVIVVNKIRQSRE
jgi:hypothetical protein